MKEFVSKLTHWCTVLNPSLGCQVHSSMYGLWEFGGLLGFSSSAFVLLISTLLPKKTVLLHVTHVGIWLTSKEVTWTRRDFHSLNRPLPDSPLAVPDWKGEVGWGESEVL